MENEQIRCESGNYTVIMWKGKKGYNKVTYFLCYGIYYWRNSTNIGGIWQMVWFPLRPGDLWIFIQHESQYPNTVESDGATTPSWLTVVPTVENRNILLTFSLSFERSDEKFNSKNKKMKKQICWILPQFLKLWEEKLCT